MKRFSLVVGIIILGFILPVSAATPKAMILGESHLSAGSPIFLDASKSVNDLAKPLVWSYKGPDVPIMYLDQGGRIGVYVFCPKPVPGVYQWKLKARGVPEGQTELDVDADLFTVTVDAPAIVPPSPGPSPSPTPTPDNPVPPPASQVTDKLRVLFLYESSDPLAPGPYEALHSTEVRKYLDSHTMTDGKLFAWRIWDKDTLLLGETPGWFAAMKTAQAKLTTTPQGQAFTPLVFAFKDTDLLDFTPVVDAASLLEWMKKYGGR